MAESPHDRFEAASLIPVRLKGVHDGLIVWHTPAEYEALVWGVDSEAAKGCTDELTNDEQEDS